LADVDSWQTISTAPFHRDLELAVVAYDGTHVLVFPCRRTLEAGSTRKSSSRLKRTRPTSASGKGDPEGSRTLFFQTASLKEASLGRLRRPAS